jgi:hypothetical protein
MSLLVNDSLWADDRIGSGWGKGEFFSQDIKVHASEQA